jgi:hypothetical protein
MSKKLTDPGLTGQVPHGTTQKDPVGAGIVADTGMQLADLVTDRPIDGIVAN